MTLQQEERSILRGHFFSYVRKLAGLRSSLPEPAATGVPPLCWLGLPLCHAPGARTRALIYKTGLASGAQEGQQPAGPGPPKVGHLPFRFSSRRVYLLHWWGWVPTGRRQGPLRPPRGGGRR